MNFIGTNSSHWQKLVFLSILFTLYSEQSISATEQQLQIQLHSADNSYSKIIGVLNITPKDTGWDYQVTMEESEFDDYFLSMRPFKCMSDKVDMLCHLPYPYQIKRKIDRGDLVDLEYDLLFIRRKPTDYGINPWNGLYYRLKWANGAITGAAYEVDLNLLAVPPEDQNVRPIQEHDLHQIEADQLWLPGLTISPFK